MVDHDGPEAPAPEPSGRHTPGSVRRAAEHRTGAGVRPLTSGFTAPPEAVARWAAVVRAYYEVEGVPQQVAAEGRW